MSYLTLEQLTKRYGAVSAVDGVDLSVSRGEFISLLGPSGCGKTTTLQMIAGFIDPTSGRALLEGRDLVGIRPNKRGLGIVFQSYALFPHATAAQNVAFGLEMRGVPRAERGKRVSEALGMVGLAGYEDRYPRRMSGGQQQRVALARALVIRPSILLLDEPLSNLDAKLREGMQTELRTIQRTLGTTTILVTHDQHEAMALSDRVVVMNKGRIEQIAHPADAYSKPATAFVAAFLGRMNTWPGEAVDGGAAIRVESYRIPMASPCPEGAVVVTVRPERMLFVGDSDPGMPGMIRSRVFQGTHWFFTADCAAGAAFIVRPNDGMAQPDEGEAIRLGWQAHDMVLRSPEVRP